MYTKNLEIKRGIDTAFRFDLRRPDGGGAYVGRGLTGRPKVSVSIKPAYGGAPIEPKVLVKQNIIVLWFPRSLTRSIQWRTSDYDIQVTDGNITYPVADGKIYIKRGIDQ